jgi:hypothetical protein
MTAAVRRGRRLATTAVLVVFGGGLAAATWVSGDHGTAIGLVVFYVVASVIAYMWSGGSGDVAAIMRIDGDERQKRMDMQATMYSGVTATMFSLVAAIVQTARGEEAFPYILVCAVGGFAYMVALAVVRWRS